MGVFDKVFGRRKAKKQPDLAPSTTAPVKSCGLVPRSCSVAAPPAPRDEGEPPAEKGGP